MGAFAAGQVVLLPFPFSDLSQSKYRPALLLSGVGRGDWLACQITSNPYADQRAVEITGADFAIGGLQCTSYARPGKLFTAHDRIFTRSLGTLQTAKLTLIREAVAKLVMAKET